MYDCSINCTGVYYDLWSASGASTDAQEAVVTFQLILTSSRTLE